MKDIFKEMEELRTRLDELSAYAEKECSKPKMFPREGDTYWWYNSVGTILPCVCENSKGRLNSFRTEQEAIKARDVQWAKQRLSHAIAVENNGWVPDWNNGEEIKHQIISKKGVLTIDYQRVYKEQPNWMYMKSKEIAEKILAEYKADLLLILGE